MLCKRIIKITFNVKRNDCKRPSQTSVAPRPTSIGGKGGGGPDGMLQILANVSLENLRVDTSEMLLETSFNLSLTWHETRAVYVILKDRVR